MKGVPMFNEADGYAIQGEGLGIDLNPVSIITREGWDD